MLKSVIGDLLAQRTVSRVDHESDVPDKLRSLGIRPAAEPARRRPCSASAAATPPPERTTTSSTTRES